MKLLFQLFLALNVIYLYFCLEDSHNKDVGAYKNETILVIPDSENGNCLNLCISTPNCRLYERKNGMCELTLTTLLHSSTIKKLRVKRKGGRTASTSSTLSDSLLPSFEGSRAARSSGNSGSNSYHNSNYYGGENDNGSSFFSTTSTAMWVVIGAAILILLLAMFFAYMTIRENAKRGSRYRPPQRNSSSSAQNQDPNVHNVNNDMYKHQKPPQFYKKLTYTSKI